MSQEPQRIHQTWIHSDRTIPARFVRPLIRFTNVAAAGGAVLLVAAIAAIIWANSPWGDTYTRFWETEVLFEIGGFHLEETFKELVNDALMVIFFFVVGLEIKRELVVGELRDPKRAALPAVAALGGMVIPALIYVAFVAGSDLPAEATRGWGIPMATDIAFSLGVISLLGSRVSVGAKLFLLALAIADDIGAIAVIAIFYTTDLSLGWLSLGILGLVVVYVGQRVGIRSWGFYWTLGIAIWFAIFESGVHATLAGVALGLLTPAYPWYSDEEYYRRARSIVERYEMDAASPRRRERVDFDALGLAAVARESVAPLERLEHSIAPWSSFVIVPIFALANAGVRFTEIDAAAAATSAVALGVAAGLFIGKMAGITGATWIAVKLGIGKLPRRTGFRQVFGLAALAGIGFTVSLFITELAFTDEFLTDAAKIGIFIGSAVAGVVGYMLLRKNLTPEEEVAEGRELIGLSPDEDIEPSALPLATEATFGDGAPAG